MLTDDILRYAEVELGGNPLWRWGVALLVAAVLFVVLLAVRGFLVRRSARWSTGPTFDAVLVEPLRAVRGWYLFLGAVLAGARTLELSGEVATWLGVAFAIATLVQVGLVLQSVASAAVARWLGRQEDAGSATLAAGMRFVARAVVWTVVLLLVLANLGIEISALVAGLGIGGVAAALAVQNVLGDLFASLGIFFDRPFDIGDFIIVGDDLGTVEKIGLRSTRVRALSGQQIVFPNADLMSSRIHNYRRMDERRVVLEVGILYGTKADQVEHGVALLREAIEAVDGVRFERAHFKGFGASSLDFEAVYWVLDRDYGLYMDKQQAVGLGLMRRFEQAGLDFAFPTRTLHVESVSDSLVRALGRGSNGGHDARTNGA